METPFEYDGSGEICMGCVEIIRPGDMVAPVSEDRPDRLLCIACWWLRSCELALPAWSRDEVGRRSD